VKVPAAVCARAGGAEDSSCAMIGGQPMDRYEALTGQLGRRLCRAAAWGLVVLAVAAGAAGAEAPREIPGGNPSSEEAEFTPKPFGKPLTIEQDGSIRTIYLLEGRTGWDQRDPHRVVYYHALELSLVPRRDPIPGFPAWVDAVRHRDDETVIDVRVRLSSPVLRDAARAKLMSDMRDHFDRERERRKVSILRVEVQKVPAWQLFMALQDRLTGLTLGHDSRHIATLGDEAVMSFRLRPESLALLLRYHKEGTLEFKPYYKVRADQIVVGQKRTDVELDLGLKAKQLLDHRQFTRLKNEDAYTVYPILQDDVNRLERWVATAIKTQVHGSPEVLTFLHSDTPLLTSVFDPAVTMTYADFRKAFPAYTEEMLASYLKPTLVTLQRAEASEHVSGQQNTRETTRQSGLGGGLGLLVGAVSLGLVGSKESAERDLNTVYNLTGVKFVRAEGEQYYKPAEIKVFKLAEGWEKKKLTQVSSVTLTKGPLRSYLEDSPVPQSYLAGVVEASLDRTLKRHNHIDRLLATAKELESARDEKLRRLGESGAASAMRADATANAIRIVADAHRTAMKNVVWPEQADGMRQWGEFLVITRGMEFNRSVFQGWLDGPANPAGGGPTRRQAIAAQRSTVAEAERAIANRAAEIGNVSRESAKEAAAQDKLRREIADLNTQIAGLMREVVSLLER
jgi:hypothetical protein